MTSSNPTLSIDKISITFGDPSSTEVDLICRKLIELFDTGRLRGSHWKPGRRYKYQLSIPDNHEDIHEPGKILLEAGPRFPGIPPYRIEFNPARIGASGVGYVRTIIDSVFGSDGRRLISLGTVTRIDLALDLPGLSNDQVIVRSRGQRKHGVYSDQRGRPETQYLGGPRGNQTVVYTKRQKMTESSLLRIERRMKPRCHAHQLSNLHDPFDKIQLVHTESLVAHVDDLNTEHLFDSIRVRGFTHVVSKLPPAQKRIVRSILDNVDRSLLPSTSEIWRSWPQLLRSSGFGLLLALDGDEAPIVPIAGALVRESA
jgi:hypothetical protein